MIKTNNNTLVDWITWATRGMFVALTTLLLYQNNLLHTLSNQLKDQNQAITSVDTRLKIVENQVMDLRNEISITRAQMVGWDVMKRIESGIGTLVNTSRSAEAMKVIGAILKGEIESRDKK